MLNWRHVDDGWVSNGFKIERISPTSWRLADVVASDAPSIAVDSDGFRVLPSLEACKYEAEVLQAHRARATSRSRLAAVGAGALAIASVSTNPVVFVGLGVIGVAALLELVMTWFDDRVGGASNFTQ